MNTLVLLSDFGDLIGDISKKLIPDPLALVTQLLATLVMFIVVYKFFWKPIKKYIEERKDYMDHEISNAQTLNEEAQVNFEISNQKIKEVKVEVRKIKEEAENQALEIRKTIIEKAEEEAQAKREKVLRDIENQVLEAEDNIRQEIVDIALLAAQKIVEREIDVNDNTRLVEDFINDVKK